MCSYIFYTPPLVLYDVYQFLLKVGHSMAIRLSKLQASTVVPVPPPTTNSDSSDAIDVNDFPVISEDVISDTTEKEPETTASSRESALGDAILASLQGDNSQFGVFDDYIAEDTAEPSSDADSWEEEDDDDDEYYYLSPSERAASSVVESFSPEDEEVSVDSEVPSEDDFFDSLYDESDFEDDVDETITDDVPSMDDDSMLGDFDMPSIDDIERDEDDAYVLRDAKGAYFPWVTEFLVNLPELDAMNNLQPDDYDLWEKLHEGDEDEEGEDLSDEQAPTATPASSTPVAPAQIGADEDVKGSRKQTKGGIAAFALRALDAVAGVLHKGSKIPLIGKLFNKAIPGTPTGRGMAGVAIALILFLLGGFVNGQITGDRMFTPSGTSSVELADNGKVSVTGISRKDGAYYAVVKNEGATNANRVYGSVHASGSEAYNPISWFNKADLGTCTFRVDSLKVGAETQAPLTCEGDVSGKGSMSFTDLIVESEEV